MSTATFLKTYAVALAVLLLLDAVWLGLVARDLYRNQLGHLLGDQIRWLPAAGFYLLFGVGVLVFAVTPALAEASAWRAIGLGALLGLIAYATYDLTNLATMRRFPGIIAAVDMVWGTVVGATMAFVAYLAASRFS